MRLIKNQNTNLRNIKGKGIKFDENDQVVMDSKKALMVPKGETADRPFYPFNGYVRYNEETEQLEAYQDDAWRKIRYKEPNRDPGIVVQSLGVGDAVEVDFGPLNSGDADYPVPVSAANVLVFVENVYQLPNTNYTLIQNPSGKPVGWYLRFGDPVPFDKPVTVLHNFDK